MAESKSLFESQLSNIFMSYFPQIPRSQHLYLRRMGRTVPRCMGCQRSLDSCKNMANRRCGFYKGRRWLEEVLESHQSKKLDHAMQDGFIFHCESPWSSWCIQFRELWQQPEDSEIEVRDMPNTSRFVLIDSIWGHEGMPFLLSTEICAWIIVPRLAGGGSNATDIEFIAGEITKFLDECTPPTGLLSKLSFYW